VTSRIDRRAFLALGVGAAAWACGRDRSAPATPTPGALSLTTTAPPEGALGVGDRRIGFALFEGQEPVAPSGVRARLLLQGGDPVPVSPKIVEVGFGEGGSSRSTVEKIFVVQHELTTPGFWSLEVEVDGRRANTAFAVLEDPAAPSIGETAPSVPSPTTADAMGVDPICTRTPVCSMHEVTIEQAIADPKPSVLIFATPKFCESRTCGPVVDVVEQAKADTGDAATFVHIEVWKSPQAVKQPDGTVDAFAAYNLGTEPVLYFLDPQGVVRDRWFGAAGAGEISDAVGALSA
jgi:hypothetical protein